MTQSHHASEKLSFDQALEARGESAVHLGKILARLRNVANIPSQARLLDIGSAGGCVLVAASELGLKAVGVEPWAPAREVATQLAEHCGVEIDVQPGKAESLEFDDESFDIVHAHAVAEHVQNPQAMFAQAYRVLKPGGVFWFCTTNSLCPIQNEIGGFPLFSWYPDRLKRRLTRWAQEHRPELIGYTDTPAIHWFTPSSARAMLSKAGFRRIYDRWDLRLNSEGGKLHAATMRLIRHIGVIKLMADTCVPAVSFAAVKSF